MLRSCGISPAISRRVPESLLGIPFKPSAEAPCRWQDWAAPDGAKRKELESAKSGSFFEFVNGERLPHSKSRGDSLSAAEPARPGPLRRKFYPN